MWKNAGIFLLISCLAFLITPVSYTQDDAGTPIEFTGPIESIDGTTIVAGGLVVDVSGIEAGVVLQLEVGITITVNGALSNGVVTATTIILPDTTPPTDPVANYTVVFNGSMYDGTATTFTYTVTGTGVSPALSHFNIEIPTCATTLEVIHL